jgi:hypothetical protein
MNFRPISEYTSNMGSVLVRYKSIHSPEKFCYYIATKLGRDVWVANGIGTIHSPPEFIELPNILN